MILCGLLIPAILAYMLPVSILVAPMKTAKVFKRSNSQALRLPKEFRFDDAEVLIKRSGAGILLLPKKITYERIMAGSVCSRAQSNGASRRTKSENGHDLDAGRQHYYAFFDAPFLSVPAALTASNPINRYP